MRVNHPRGLGDLWQCILLFSFSFLFFIIFSAIDHVGPQKRLDPAVCSSLHNGGCAYRPAIFWLLCPRSQGKFRSWSRLLSRDEAFKPGSAKLLVRVSA
ncbi:hypothetical protein BDV59DRAFT_62964 [Aspergillus ambiguus]|uniref:uncharacterized protein n=1 Tax=Aspergillus ambiguus TaxID=176160 RepID=UPI003CCD7873